MNEQDASQITRESFIKSIEMCASLLTRDFMQLRSGGILKKLTIEELQELHMALAYADGVTALNLETHKEEK